MGNLPARWSGLLLPVPQDVPLVGELSHQASHDLGDGWREVEQAPCPCKTENAALEAIRIVFQGGHQGSSAQPTCLWGHAWFSRSGCVERDRLGEIGSEETLPVLAWKPGGLCAHPSSG